MKTTNGDITRLGMLFGLLGMGVLTSACSDDGAADDDVETSSDSDDVDDSDSESSGTTGVEVEELEPGSAPDCELIPGDHSALCGDEPCPIVDDVELHCNDIYLGNFGVGVAVDEQAAYAAVSGFDGAWLMSAVGDQGELDVLPNDYSPAHIELTQDLEGALYLGNDRSRMVGGDYHSDIAFTLLDQPGMVAETLYSGVNEVPEVYGLEFDYQGRAHIWFEAKPFGGDLNQLGVRHGVRLDAASWWQNNALDQSSGYFDFGITPAGDPVTVSLEYEDGEYQLYAERLGQHDPLGDRLPFARTPLLPELPKPEPLATGPDYLALIGDEVGLQLVWPEIAGWSALPLPNTAPETSECVLECPCPTNCNETGTGVPGLGYAVARTSDGAVWVAWITRDEDIEFVVSEEEWDGDCLCQLSVASDHSTAALHLGRVDPQLLALEEKLTMPIARPDVELWWKIGREIDLVAFGDRLGLVLRLYDEGDFSPQPTKHLRLLGIDTAAL